MRARWTSALVVLALLVGGLVLVEKGAGVRDPSDRQSLAVGAARGHGHAAATLHRGDPSRRIAPDEHAVAIVPSIAAIVPPRRAFAVEQHAPLVAPGQPPRVRGTARAPPHLG